MKTARLLALLALVLSPAARAQTVSITACGTAIPDHAVGSLDADLTCRDPSSAIVIGTGATLALNGHTVQGIAISGQQSLAVVRCTTGACTVLGPGGVGGNDGTTPLGACISGPAEGPLVVTTNGQGIVDIHDCYEGVVTFKSSRISDVDVHDCTVGINGQAEGARLARVNASNNHFCGVFARRVYGKDITANGNARFGLIGGAAKGKVKAQNVTATGNGDAGVIGSSVKLRTATVTGNDGYAQGIDIASFVFPHLTATTCAKSGQIASYYTNGPPPLVGSWGVCSAD
jgi:hypothetical protein